MLRFYARRAIALRPLQRGATDPFGKKFIVPGASSAFRQQQADRSCEGVHFSVRIADMACQEGTG
jgi:hypothetical protein